MQDTNTVIIAGRLTKDPELRSIPSGASVAELRVANTKSVKRGESYEDAPNYFDVVVWGRRGEVVAEHLSKGSQIIVTGRLDWREWTAQDGGKRQAVSIVSEHVQFVGGKSDAPATAQPTAQGPSPDDDIPF